MPQLNLAWWSLNFLIGWITIIIIFSILLKKNILQSSVNMHSSNNETTISNTPNWLWN
uniref:ATP synthase complex subunit 8 n=1 Tax=Linckia laevigata TaxID=109185 RepID=A0A679EA74_LINLA|nr:ATPase subuint 8 [Linckia laevigata]